MFNISHIPSAMQGHIFYNVRSILNDLANFYRNNLLVKK